ncbi:hypothetical protein [Microbacterium sp. zg-YB36]|uniref:Mom family adenine methylcarbamoylation protein n=1 Tax=Microbacterium sp. zg-YB36 TaxID=2969407 RepID=UPI00214C0AC4|nr:hypothetical protein [Microbacterium sp. zg-YB36]MDL5351115.1 hypothetical protein [Microbacterium sp. zg-YB36]
MNGYTVRQIPGGMGRDFIKEHHYTKGCHNGPMCWGLFDSERLIGVCAFATPSSENVRSSVFGVEHKSRVTELHRLVILDETPTNTESWFIVRALRGLQEYRPGIWAVLSFADGTEGHVGTIYQATNALYCGTTGRSRFWRDQTGRLRHPRQNGHNITPEEAAERGWVGEMRDAKHRYLFLLGDGPAHRRMLRRLVQVNVLEGYPKRPEVAA